ncbi:hypothetical protein HYH03_007218 [Edaphochlamys debaryana]|uniref:Protein kinase domain-containing protein n=1 Tax=Edaphochlamys debaryana TaxID=47281 RepID=A0A835YBX7_9CHLO|nr:hypothetical protein HYH03_007218 [Edaphochlamys debaryana]|eukprot:KAG2494704.1 hypothetical protein HYH03_007218 [Edaphochlamys debaryana]
MPRSGPGVDINLISREIQSHRVLRHPHVIRFKQLGLTSSHIYMCMEYADQGDLLGFLRRKGPLPEADTRWLFQQIIFGLDYCHLKGVVNRDLKPENLLLKLTPEASKRHRRHQMAEREQAMAARQQLAALALQQAAAGGGPPPPPPAMPPLTPIGLVDHRTSNTFNLHIKIADFGLSKKAQNSLPKTRVGTINYMAPEVLLAGPSQRYDGAKADIWSAGVVLYAMLFSRVPFESHDPVPPGGDVAPPAPPGGRDRAATIQRILAGEWSVPPGMGVSPQCLHLLTQMLVPDPARRIPMQAIMEHPWFRAGLPPAALTMNTALVKQQLAQGPGSLGEQPEAEIDAILDELRLQGEREVASALASVYGSRGDSGEDSLASASTATDRTVAGPDRTGTGLDRDREHEAERRAAAERRAFEVKGFEDESPAASAGRQANYAGGGDGAAQAAAAAAADGRCLCASTGERCAHSPGASGAAGTAGGVSPSSQPTQPNAFLARLAGMGIGDLPAAAGAAGGRGGGGGGNGGGGGLAVGSSESRRAEAFGAIDCITLAPGGR